MESYRICHILTIEECGRKIKELDPETAVTSWFIRQLVKENKVQCHFVGKKALVDFDDLINFLNFRRCE